MQISARFTLNSQSLADIHKIYNFISLLSISLLFINPTLRQSFQSYIDIHFPHKLGFFMVPIIFHSSCRSQLRHNVGPSIVFTHLETAMDAAADSDSAAAAADSAADSAAADSAADADGEDADADAAEDATFAIDLASSASFALARAILLASLAHFCS